MGLPVGFLALKIKEGPLITKMLLSSQPNTCHHTSKKLIRLLPLSYAPLTLLPSTKTTTTMSQTVHRLHSYLRSAGACLVSSPRPPPRRLVCIATVSDRSNQSNVLLWKGRVSHHKLLSVAAKASSSAPQGKTYLPIMS